MWLLILRAIEVVVVLGGVVASIYAAALWLKAQKHQSVAEAKDEVINAMVINVEAWKSRYEVEHLEIVKYRNEVHTKSEGANLRIIDLSNENAMLKVKTDLSPVMELMGKFIKEQTEINAKVLASLTNLEKRTNGTAQPPKLNRGLRGS